MTLLRRRRGDELYGGEVAPLYPHVSPAPSGRTPAVPTGDQDAESPSRFRRWGRAVDDWRRRILPLPDEIIDQYLGHGERMIHNDHPSLGAFIVQNTILLAGLFFVAVVFFGVTFNGSLATAGVAFLVFGVVALWLVLRRLRERYTSYVVTNVRILRISGVFARRAHSIPWVRVTDLTYEQSLIGRLFGYATLHIESANEEGGLRDLEGVSDPIRFNQYIVDMVVAKQGPTAPGWEEAGAPAPIIALPRSGVMERLRANRRRRRESRAAAPTAPGEAERTRQPDVGPPVARRPRPATAPVRTDLPASFGSTSTPTPPPGDEPSEDADTTTSIPPSTMPPYDADQEDPDAGRPTGGGGSGTGGGSGPAPGSDLPWGR